MNCMATGSVLMILAVSALAIHLAPHPVEGIQDQSYSNVEISRSARKLLHNSTIKNDSREPPVEEGEVAPLCDSDQVIVRAGPISLIPLTYTAEVVNICKEDDCKIGDIQLNCLFFLPTTPVYPPGMLKLIAPGVCILNDGKPLNRNEVISFTYPSPLPYQFGVIHSSCF